MSYVTLPSSVSVSVLISFLFGMRVCDIATKNIFALHVPHSLAHTRACSMPSQGLQGSLALVASFMRFFDKSCQSSSISCKNDLWGSVGGVLVCGLDVRFTF